MLAARVSRIAMPSPQAAIPARSISPRTISRTSAARAPRSPLRLPAVRPAPRHLSAWRIRAMAEKPDDPNPSNPSTESLFMRELKRRQSSQSSNSQSDAASKPPGGGASAGSGGRAGGSGAEGSARDQLAASRALNSEGLEGLPARASELIKLGLSFYLPLWPFALTIVVSFTALYLFVHPGKSYGEARQPPTYIDPYELLQEEEKYMERVPYDLTNYYKDNYDPELDG